MNATLNPVSEGNQRTRPTVCEQPFMEGLPPSSDGGGLDPERRNVKGKHCSDAPHVTEQQRVVSPLIPKCLWKVQILKHLSGVTSHFTPCGVKGKVSAQMKWMYCEGHCQSLSQTSAKCPQTMTQVFVQ